jgi:hypothetical protein
VAVNAQLAPPGQARQPAHRHAGLALLVHPRSLVADVELVLRVPSAQRELAGVRPVLQDHTWERAVHNVGHARQDHSRTDPDKRAVKRVQPVQSSLRQEPRLVMLVQWVFITKK